MPCDASWTRCAIVIASGLAQEGKLARNHEKRGQSDLALEAVVTLTLCYEIPYFFAVGFAGGELSAFHVSRMYNHLPPSFFETDRYLPASTTLPALSVTE